MQNIKNSFLNVVAATHADAIIAPASGSFSGKTLISITGLNPMVKTPNKNYTYYTTVATSGTAQSATYDFTGAVTVGRSYGIAFTYFDTFGNEQQIVWTLIASSTSGTTAATDLYNRIYSTMSSAGFTVTDDGAGVVTIAAAKNQAFQNTQFTTGDYAAGYAQITITPTAEVVRLGYGADLLTHGYSAATSATGSDGIVGTNYYQPYVFMVSGRNDYGATSVEVQDYTQILWINIGVDTTADTNAAALISYLDATVLA